MLKSLNDWFYSPLGTTLRQQATNDAEWRKPENWSRGLWPRYSSKLDTRPFVPGRLFRPKSENDERWAWLSRGTPNWGHPRGRIYALLGWTTVIVVALASLAMQLMEALR
jgi:hypothetical protein